MIMIARMMPMVVMMMRRTTIVMTIPTLPGSEDSDYPDGRPRLHSVESDPLGERQESFQHPTGPIGNYQNMSRSGNTLRIHEK